ncbi:hypothetical protein PENSTE_c035G06276 [Penicillium steckii]|uniref:Copper-fist domain-containing protein n=1 Tax=Penicillium steckii TaxID=303698 RepID=A0A1V6SLA0_9EURO|nr:hypothetical protein PENSTE_c035G06276 [Penicillium steckii]
MPLDEDGAKWSCEPCIRGHRSSKCQHFDRLMMKVPKAGRPLAKCPHPKGSCSCQRTFSMMIRIPKGTGCVCRPVAYETGSQDEDSNQNAKPVIPSRIGQPAHASLPASTSSPTSNKIHKPGKRQGSIQTVPENIARALESMPMNLKFEDKTAENSIGLSSYPVENQGQDGSNLDIRPNDAYTTIHGFPEMHYPAQQNTGSSCCSKKTTPAPPPPPPAPTAAIHGGGSCCSGKTKSQPTVPPPPVSQMPDLPQQHQASNWNGASYSNFTTPQMAWHSSMPSTQPPSQGQLMRPYGMHGNHMPPFYADGFSQNGPSTPYSHSMNGLGIAHPSMSSYTSTPSHSSTYTPTNMSGDPSHDCQCGEECQCLGCAAHPFNNTTRQRVQEMGEMMTIGGDKSAFDTYQSPPFQAAQNWDQINYLPQGLDHGLQQSAFDPYSGPSHTPSNAGFTGAYSSPVPVGQSLNEQLMHTSEYYTLEYPWPQWDVVGSTHERPCASSPESNPLLFIWGTAALNHHQRTNISYTGT